MIKLTKEKLLHYFPYKAQGGATARKNRSIYDVLGTIEKILWADLSLGNPDRPADIELKLIEYQADVAQQKNKLEKIKESLTDAEKEDLKQYTKEQMAIIKRNVPKEYKVKSINVPFETASDPEKFEAEVAALDEKYQDLNNRLEKIQETFDEKMKELSTINLPNTELFTRQEVKHLRGHIIKAVRPLLAKDPAPAEDKQQS